MSATSPLSSHYYPTTSSTGGSASATTTPSQASKSSHSHHHRRSPSPQSHHSESRSSERSMDRSAERYLSQRRLIEEDRDRLGESELNALAMQQQQMEFERYAKFYGAAPHSMLAPGPVPPHLMMPGFEHMSEAAAAAHLMRPSAAGPGGPSPAALMSSLHQAAYLMYPPTGNGGGGGGSGPPGAPYLPASSMPYYQQYMAAAAAAMYGRGSPLWPYMAAGGIPGPPGSPMGMPGRMPSGAGMHHSPQMMHGSMQGREERGSAFPDRSERMSPGSPLALRIGDRDRGSEREAAIRESAMAMEQSREDPGK